MYYQSLQSLRGFFALMIFFHHFNLRQGSEGMFGAGGDLGVSFFFILSGFVLSQAYYYKEWPIKWENLLKFVYFRLAKIYPLHIVCLLLAIIIKLSFSISCIANLFLLQAWVPLKEWYFSGNAVGWCLSDFLFFYAMFPFLIHALKHHRLYFIRFFWIIVFLHITLIIPSIPDSFVDGIVYINPLTRILDFAFGMVLWDYLRIAQKNGIHPNFIDAMIILLLSIAVWYIYPSRYNLSLLWWPSISLLIVYAIESNPNFLSFRPFVKFGEVSFSFYLIHVIEKNYIDILLKKFEITFPPFIRLMLILSITIISAFFLHQYFVLPIEKKMKSLMKNNTKAEAPNSPHK